MTIPVVQPKVLNIHSKINILSIIKVSTFNFLFALFQEVVIAVSIFSTFLSVVHTYSSLIYFILHNQFLHLFFSCVSSYHS